MIFHGGLLAYLIALSCTTIHAFRIDLHGQRKPANKPRITRRANITGVQLNDTADISYYANLSLGGRTFQLLVDTGSSDLWVAGNVPNTNDTKFTASVQYAVGSVQGPVQTARLDFDGKTVPDQAFLEVVPDSNNPDGSGILGLGPNSGSNIYETVGSTVGAAVADRIFLQNTSTPNFVTVLLGRSDDPSHPFPGSITIGDILSDYVNVLDEPKLPVTAVVGPQGIDQHFQVLLDQDGLIGPDGRPIPLRTNVTTTPNPNQATVIFDTGFSLPQIPESAADAIYSRFSGAELQNIQSIGLVWILPCSQEVNITFKFAGQRYPIHPLDLSLDPSFVGMSSLTNSQGQKSCIGTFQPVSFKTGSTPQYDMVLGMAFLRNVYMVMNYGDFIVGSTNKANPYIQFLSITDPAEAHADFVKARLNGVDTTNQTRINYNGNPGPSGRLIGAIIAAVLIVILAVVVGFIIYRKKHYMRRRIDDVGSPLVAYPSPQTAMYGLSSPPLYKTTTVFYETRQPRHTSSPYTPNRFQPPQYYPHQVPYL
ncbi:acid protease [Tricholoma matsutake]|nr:acid protease [Tricholoma matsutake 945]